MPFALSTLVVCAHRVKIDPMHPFEKKLALAWPPPHWRDVTVLVALSGGADSVALLRAMAALRTADTSPQCVGALCAAHLNHRLRGEEADADERFVAELCRRWDIPCEVGHADVAAELPPGGAGLETVARNARYQFLESAAARCGARYVAVAHTADDQAETILHRILRGTAVAGLSGMPRARPLGHAGLLRPLLDFRRSEVLGYLSDIGQPFRTDRTNADLRFTRNRLRHELLPHLAREYNPNVVEALLRLGRLAGEVQQWMQQQVEPLREACCRAIERPGRGVHLDPRRLESEPAALVRELLVNVWRRQGWPMQQMGFEQWDLLADLARAAGKPSGPVRKQTLPGGIMAESGPKGLLLYRR